MSDQIRGEFTYREILSQPETWRAALDVYSEQADAAAQAWAAAAPRQIVFTGCGSTHYLSMTGAALFQTLTGVLARAVPASEILFYPANVFTDPEHTLLIVVSRSGTTSETVAAMAAFRRMGGPRIWSVSCVPDTPVATQVDFAIVLPAAQEQSMAQTRSFASMLLVIEALAAQLGGQDTAVLKLLPSVCKRLLDGAAAVASRLGNDLALSKLFFLGSGPQFGIASEGMLKMKEMSLTGSEAYHFLEFRHGPKSMVDEQALVIGLVDANAAVAEEAVLAEMRGLGGLVVTIAPRSEEADEWTISLPARLPGWALPVLYLPALQLLAYERSMAKGLDPDVPRNLDPVVYLEL